MYFLVVTGTGLGFLFLLNVTFLLKHCPAAFLGELLCCDFLKKQYDLIYFIKACSSAL